jgi:lipopolysaccharide export system protein LptA
MVSHRDPGNATYTGNARLWQTSSLVQAPIIQFDRDTRTVVAQGTPDYRVSTVFIQSDSKGKQTPVHIVSDHLTYSDNERTAFFKGAVVAKSEDATLTSDESEVYLLPQSSTTSGGSTAKKDPVRPGNTAEIDRATTATSGPEPKTSQSNQSQTAAKDQPPGSNKIEKIVADGHVVVIQPTRRALGSHLVYTTLDDRFVLTGGSPSIFDAERGKVTGDSLTFYKRDDRVLVEGKANSPAFTETRVAR